jgi:hypothetical protein
MELLLRHGPAARAAITVSLALACSLGRAAPESAAELTPAGAPLPAFTLADPTDFDELRDAWGRRMDYRALCETSLPTPAWAEAEQAKDFAKAYDIAAKWLATCPVVERVHMWAYGDAKQIGDSARMDIHKRWYQGLIKSVLKTGDGKTPETAWKTISVSEEYAVLQYYGLARGPQALVMHPVMVDKLTAKPIAGGDPVDLYFNPELHFARLARELGQK